MSTLRRPLTASLAAVAALGLALTGCTSQEEPATQEAMRSAEARLDQAEERLRELEDRVDRQVDLSDLRAEAEGALSGLEGASQDARARADSLLGSLPAVEDVVDVEAVKDQGKVIVDYAEDALPQDPQELERTLREAAEKAKRSVPDLEDVEFRVGDRTFTF